MRLVQPRNYGLGNFITVTPAITAMSQKTNEKMQVYFETSSIASIFRECPYIQILKSYPKKALKLIRPDKIIKKSHKRETDYELWYRFFMRSPAKNIPPPYVDSSSSFKLPKKPGKKYMAIFHGCLSKTNKSIQKKNLGSKTLSYFIETSMLLGYTPVLLGSKSDLQFWKKVNRNKCIDYIAKLSLKESVSVLSQCDFFLSNDTGLYHVAGALSVPGIVVWKGTDRWKNLSPCDLLTHIHLNDIHLNDIHLNDICGLSNLIRKNNE